MCSCSCAHARRPSNARRPPPGTAAWRLRAPMLVCLFVYSFWVGPVCCAALCCDVLCLFCCTAAAGSHERPRQQARHVQARARGVTCDPRWLAAQGCSTPGASGASGALHTSYRSSGYPRARMRTRTQHTRARIKPEARAGPALPRCGPQLRAHAERRTGSGCRVPDVRIHGATLI